MATATGTATIPAPSMYCKPPGGEVKFDYLSDVLLRRLKMLTILEKVPKREPQVLRQEFRQQGLWAYAVLIGSKLLEDESVDDALQEDLVSHFILRFKFCRSPTMRSWFQKLEWKWFKVRFNLALDMGLKLNIFLNDNKLHLETVSDFPKQIDLQLKLETVEGVTFADTFKSDIYDVRFEDAPLLVAKRRCILERGRAYFIDKQMVGYLKHVFAKRLDEALVNMSRFEIDQRIDCIVSQLNVNVRTLIYSTVDRNMDLDIEQAGSITKLLDNYSNVHYPLCMKFIHQTYKDTNHLRYYARMQYGLFIKGMGVPYDEAMKFWEEGFTKKFTQDIYKREYAYLFKHQYGLVGSKIDYAPYDCKQIITSKMCGLDQHGCPFAHYDSEILSSKLLGLGITQFHVSHMHNLVESKKYRKACAYYFNIVNGVDTFESMCHPNEYLYKSQAINPQGGQKTLPCDIPDIEDIFRSDSD